MKAVPRGHISHLYAAHTSTSAWAASTGSQPTAWVASATVIAYAIYTLTADHSRVLLATVPFVVFGVFRYLLLMHRDDVGEEPEQVLLTDVPILLAVGGWIVTAAAILAIT